MDLKRPMLMIAVMMVIAAVICDDGVASINIMVPVGLVIFLILVLYIKRKRISYAYMLLFLFYPLVIARAQQDAAKLSLETMSVSGLTVEIRGEVEDIVDKGDYRAVTLKNAVIHMDADRKMPCVRDAGVMVYTDSDGFLVGDRLCVMGDLKAFEPPRNKGNFNTRNYYLSSGIHYRCSARETTIEYRDRDGLASFLYRLKVRLRDIFEKVYNDEQAGLVSSMVLGDKSGLDEQIKELYQRNGIAHLLAISGLHVSLAGMSIYSMLRKKMHFFNAAAISILLVLFYLILTGNNISAVRAVVMVVIKIAADVLGRTYDAASALSFAAILLIWDNTFVVLNTGFQMSFLAIAGIIFIYPIFSNNDSILFFKRPRQDQMSFCAAFLLKALDAFLYSFSIQLATLPVVLGASYEIPVISLFLNCIVIPLMPMVMVSGILTGVAGMISIRAAYFFAGASFAVLDFYKQLCSVSKNVKYALIITGMPDLKIIALYVFILGVWAFIYFADINLVLDQAAIGLFQKRGGYKGRGRAVWNLAFMIPLALVMYEMRYIPYKGLTVYMIDVGQGDSIYVHSASGKNYLFDGGSTDVKEVGKYRIYPYLRSAGVHVLDEVFLSHTDKDHISAIKELIHMCGSTFSIKTLVMPDIKDASHDSAYMELITLAQEAGIEVKYAHTFDRVDDGMLQITCLHPCIGYEYESANDYSAVYKLSYGDFSMLMMGDAEKKAEACMIGDVDIGNVTVLKVGHHGSETSTSEEFLAQASPGLAVVSCGVDNAYHHPSQEILSRLKASNVRYYITSACGGIEITTDGKKVDVLTYITAD